VIEEDQPISAKLRPSSSGVQWTREGVEWCAIGSPLLVEWTSPSGQIITWTPVALQQAGPEPLAAKWEWICIADQGWTDFSAQINNLLSDASECDGKVSYEIDGEMFEADMRTRTQTSLKTGAKRAIRPACATTDLVAMQGLWRTGLQAFDIATVNGKNVYLDENPTYDLKYHGDGSMSWTFGKFDWHATRQGVTIVWSNDVDQKQMIWTPVPDL